MIRQVHRRLCQNVLSGRAGALTKSQLNRSAVIFSPHYDDETLGVGGTIIQKRKAGARVKLVFMTDGSRSHAGAIEGALLSAMRRSEALRAASILGVPEVDVTFLELPETRLSQHRPEALRRVAAVLSGFDCEEVYVPSQLEPLLWSADHNVTTDVVFQALSQSGRRPEILEYVIWFWYHWPWVPVERGVDIRRLLKLSWASRFGIAACAGLNACVPIGDVIGQKRNALDQYETQMTRIMTDRPWPILSDVADGEFLKWFFQKAEYFRRYRYQAPNSDN
jgi:LmbE family N-acetylglucosaminyl deacetylase